MDTNIDAIETPETTDSFAVEIGKALALSFATTAGTFVGLVVIGAVVTKAQKIKADRDAKKTEKDS